ncbi:putative disease resistance protein At4g19050 [Henckelia pumila]|uniref:putative disease resistance protein At4g19050 n=1 Tax=Henckelia pumila TaxID=405737 RepID=UPI003C6E676C
MGTSEKTPPPTMADPPGIIIDKQHLMAAMDTVGSDEALRKAFDVILSSSMGTSKAHVSVNVIQLAMPILGMDVEAIKNDIANLLTKAQVESAENIDCQGFIKIIKNIWKDMADSMIKQVEDVLDEFISNKDKLENICREFSNSVKDTWKREADSIIHEVEKGIDEFISDDAGQETDGIIPLKLIDNMRDIWKKVTDLKIQQVKKEIDDESIPNKIEIKILKYLWKRVVDSTTSRVEKEMDEFISNKSSDMENLGDIRGEFISRLKEIWKGVDDWMMEEEVVGWKEVVKMAPAIVLAERLSGNVCVALLPHLIPYLGGYLEEAEIMENIKDFKDNNAYDTKIDFEEFIQIIRNIWKKSAEFLSKAIFEKDGDANQKAFTVLHNPLDDFASATIINVVMLNLDENLDFEELHRTINYVKANSTDHEQIKYEGFVEIIDYARYLKEKTPLLDKIYGVLTREKTRKVVLYGESGVGKTWMATKIADRTTRKGNFDIALWVNLKGLNLTKIIAHQLSLLSASDDMEPEKVKEVLKEGKKKSKSLEERICEAMKNKRVLLIFDGVNGSEELSQGSKLLTLLNLNDNYKVLITTSAFKQEYKREAIGIEVRRWTNDQSESFLINFMGAGNFSKVKDLARFYIQGSKGLPAEILIIAKTLNYFANSHEEKLQGVKEVVLEDVAHDYYGYRNIEKLFISTEVVPKVVLVDCYSSETPAKHFLNERGAVHYNELISYWILEGHLGHFSCIEDAYEEGHRVLMELLDCGLLKPLKAGYVKSNGKKFEFSTQDYFDLYQKNRLGLATTFDNKLGNTVLGHGMIRTFPSDKEIKEKKKEEEVEKMSTLLLDGDRTGEVSENLFDSIGDLEILAIFDPTHKPFPLRISSRQSLLRFLVLRGCEFFTRFDEVFASGIPTPTGEPRKEAPNLQKSLSRIPIPTGEPRKEAPNLQKSLSLPAPRTQPISSDLSSISEALSELIVLEISGPSSLKEIPENLFDIMGNLKSLNMSSLKMEFLPPSFYSLTSIEILILRDCSCLKRMDSLKKFKKLQLLDLSGATSLEAFKDKSFSENGQLQTINLSQSKIAKFPVVHSLTKLQYLSLRQCPDLIRVRKIGSVKTLRVFDISGSKKVEQLLDPGLQKLENLFALNVSGTAIRRLPSTIGTPRYLHLSNCSNLKQLPPIETLNEVRDLDLSGSALLDDVKPEFIKSLKNLTRLNLSKTGVVHLHSLSSLVNLRHLLASQCPKLEKLEGLGSLINLEVLDLSGCKAFSEIENQAFDKMDRLHCLDLSETPLKELPSLSKLKKLQKLNLRGCTKLTNIPGLEDLTVLEDLDISKTTLKEPDFKDRARPSIVQGPRPSSYKKFDHEKILKNLEPAPHEQAIGETEVDQQTSGETKINFDDKTKLTQEMMDQCDHWSILNRLASHNSEPVTDAHFLQLLKLYPDLLKGNIETFQFIVYPMEEAAQQSINNKDLLQNEFDLKKILLRNVSPEAQEHCLEIRGFRDFPKFLEPLLEHAEMMVLIENSCIRFLSCLGADHLKKMKVCWIERCNEMEYVTDEVPKDSADVPTENIEILWVSEAAKLKSICKETSRGIGFSALTSLYLEYCPELSSLCFSCKQLNGLKILHVKYCKKLVKLLDDKSAQLPNLESLHLWALPALKEISCGMQFLLTLTVAHCPLLEYIFDSDTSFPTNHERLQLHVKFCENIKTILRVGHLPSDVRGENIITLGCTNLLESQIPKSSAPRNP